MVVSVSMGQDGIMGQDIIVLVDTMHHAVGITIGDTMHLVGTISADTMNHILIIGIVTTCLAGKSGLDFDTINM